MPKTLTMKIAEPFMMVEDKSHPWRNITFRPIYTGQLNAEPPELLSADAARMLCGGMAKSTWYKLKLLGKIPAPIRIGGRVYWRREDLRTWIEMDRPGCEKFKERKRTAMLHKKRHTHP